MNSHTKSYFKYLYGGNREKVIKRDNEKCVRCGVTREEHKLLYGKDITVDHIDRNGKNKPAHLKNNSLENLQTLCFKCHGSKSFVDKQQPRSTHGKLSMYTNYGCRCELCVEANKKYQKGYRVKKRVKNGRRK